MLDPARRPSAAPVVDGHLDLLRDGAAGVAPAAALQRPLLRVLAKGPLGPGAREEHRIARLLLGLGPGDAVLDAGCGDGAFARDFARIVGPRGIVVGVDGAADALKHAAAATPAAAASDGNVALVRADVARLPFRTGAFGAICCFGVLHELAEPFAALDELTRVLARGGRIALMTTCRTRTAPARTWDAFVGARAGVRMFEPDEVTDALEARGFDPVRRRVAGLLQFVGGRLPA
jgi:SAM-dependent methyltransferase